MMNMKKLRVTVWSEGLPSDEVKALACYPEDINTAIAGFLGRQEDFVVEKHGLQEPECGLSNEILDQTDVLVWWSHLYNEEIPDAIADKVVDRVLSGMGLILLHSSMGSKPARKLLGKCNNVGKYREVGERELVWLVDRSHPVAQGLSKEYIEVPNTEMYGEPYGMPTPDELVFISWFEGGEVLRSGAGWHRGAGKVFFFAPGHEEFPVYFTPDVQTVITNAVRWAKPVCTPPITQHGPMNDAPTLSPLISLGRK